MQLKKLPTKNFSKKIKSKKKNYWHFPWLLTPPSSKILKNKKIKQS